MSAPTRFGDPIYATLFRRVLGQYIVLSIGNAGGLQDLFVIARGG